MNPDDFTSEDSSALQLLAAVRHPAGDELLRKVTVAEKLLPWLKWIVSIMVAVFLMALHAEIRLMKVGENADKIKDHSGEILELQKWRIEIDSAKKTFDLQVVPQIAIWARTSEDFKKFQDHDLLELQETIYLKRNHLPPFNIKP